MLKSDPSIAPSNAKRRGKIERSSLWLAAFSIVVFCGLSASTIWLQHELDRSHRWIESWREVSNQANRLMMSSYNRLVIPSESAEGQWERDYLALLKGVLAMQGKSDELSRAAQDLHDLYLASKELNVGLNENMRSDNLISDLLFKETFELKEQLRQELNQKIDEQMNWSRQITAWVATTLTALIGCVIAFIALIKRRLIRPMREISRVATQYASTGQLGELNHPYDDEFGVTVSTFKSIYKKLDSQIKESESKNELLAREMERHEHARCELTDAFDELTKTNTLLECAEKLGKVGAFILDTRMERLTISEQGQAILGLDGHPDSFTLQSIIGLCPDASKVEMLEQQLGRLRMNAIGFDIELPVLNPKIGLRWVNMHCEAAVPPGSAIVKSLIGAFRDVTEQRENTINLTRALQVERNLNDSRTEFITHLSHEIRTPMNAIYGLLQLLLETEHLSPAQLELVKAARSVGVSLVDLVTEVLDMEKMKAGGFELSPVEFVLSDMLDDLGLLFQGLANPSVAISVQYPSDVASYQVIGDSQRLRQVLINLVGNALKFTQSGEVVLQVRQTDITRGRVTLQFSCRDTGIGMDTATQRKIFEPFEQGAAGISKHFGGTGLGLYLSQKLIQTMGGTIKVSSQPGVGSLFWFTLEFQSTPRVPGSIVPKIELEHPNVQAEENSMPLAGLRILIVDDNAMNRKVLRRILENRGAVLLEASDGAEAIKALETHGNLNTCLMDLQMPVMDGIAATSALRKMNQFTRLPIIGLTAAVNQDIKDKAIHAGMDDLLPKPFDVDKVVRMILDRCMSKAPLGLNDPS